MREVAKSVLVKNVRTKKIQNTLRRMKEALHAEEDGAAIAAPQIGESLRIFIVSKKITKTKDLVFINPEIIKTSK
ncbi:MAG: hypothetical protein UX77_C0027G0001, partial [Parcubacteria group bacterium GW2011_GWA1_47_11]